MADDTHLNAILCALSDPERKTPDVPDEVLPALVDKARLHGVSPVVLRKLEGNRDPAILQDMRIDVEARVVLTLKLRLLAAQISRFVDENDLDAAIIKGPVFAEKLYSIRGDRPFTDLDVLCAEDARLRVGAHLSDAGFVQAKRPLFDRSETNMEEKWVRGGSPQLMVELHGDLVHYSALRRRTRFSYPDLMRIDGTMPDAPLCLFFTSVVHAALGHKFHQLRLMVDVLQAFRRLSEADRRALAVVARKMRLRIETANCLRLIAELFSEEDALAAAKTVLDGLSWNLSAHLLTAQAVLDAPDSAASRVRRHGFRLLQKSVGR